MRPSGQDDNDSDELVDDATTEDDATSNQGDEGKLSFFLHYVI